MSEPRLAQVGRHLGQAGPVDPEPLDEALECPVDLPLHFARREMTQDGRQVGQKRLESEALIERRLRPPPPRSLNQQGPDQKRFHLCDRHDPDDRPLVEIPRG